MTKLLHFAPDSAALSASADEVLRPLVESARRCRVRQVDVIGHIACTTLDGRDSSNLSGRRAQAVASRLEALGLPPSVLGTVVGRGANEPVIPNLTPDGRFIESAAVLNRRVEVTLWQ
ncbi:OmpA family protein [Nocardia sp. NPDC003999]